MTRTAWGAQARPTEVDEAWNRAALDAVAQAYGFDTFREFATRDLEVHQGRAGSRAVYDIVHRALAGVFPEVERLRAVEAEADTLRGELAALRATVTARAGGRGDD